jgi:glyoxylase I family protein
LGDPFLLHCGIPENSISADVVEELAERLREEDGMGFQRRQLLQILSYAVGSSFILPQNELAMAAQNSARAAGPARPAKAASKHESGGTEMEKVAGIGGLFFRAHDPKALGNWYEQHLGIALTPTTEGATVWQQEAGPTVFSPFPETTKYFGDPNKVWMVNFRVHDLDKMVTQLRKAGIEVKDPESYANVGRFSRLHDPEGNPIELWQPS